MLYYFCEFSPQISIPAERSLKMPSFIVHHAFALETAQAAPSAVAHLCAAFPFAYSWGSQGPDPFFFSPWARIGCALHHDAGTAAVFQSMAEAVGGSHMLAETNPKKLMNGTRLLMVARCATAARSITSCGLVSASIAKPV